MGTGDNTEEPLGKIAGIYRVNSDGTIEALESARVEAAEKASEIQELIDSEVALTHWTEPDGTGLEETSLRVDGTEVCASSPRMARSFDSALCPARERFPLPSAGRVAMYNVIRYSRP